MTFVWLVTSVLAALLAFVLIQLRAIRSYLITATHRTIRAVSHGEKTHVHMLLTETIRAFEARGFTYQGSVMATGALVSECTRPETEHYLSRDDDMWAQIRLSPLPNARRPVAVTLLSWSQNDTLVVTYNHRTHTVWPPRPACREIDIHTDDLCEFIETHVQNGPFMPVSTLECVLEKLDRLDAQALNNAAHMGWLTTDRSTQHAFRPSWRGAWQMMRHVRSPVVKQHAPDLLYSDLPHAEAITVTFGEGLERYYRRIRPARSRNLSRALAAISLLLATGSFLFWFPAWQVALFMGILLAHEFGHLIAMRLTGHMEASIFFLPFFGAATVGRKKNSSSAERVFVALMGSLPGLMVAGLAFPWILDGSLLDNPTISLGWTLLVGINWLNLMPVLPFDGGHILNLIVFSRFPLAESAFRLLSFTSFLLVGLWFDQPLVIIPFAIALLVAASQHKVALLAREMRLDPAHRSDQRFQKYAHHLLKRYGSNLPFPTALALVEATEWRQNQHPLPLMPAVAYLGLYACACILPPVGWWFLFH